MGLVTQCSNCGEVINTDYAITPLQLINGDFPCFCNKDCLDKWAERMDIKFTFLDFKKLSEDFHEKELKKKEKKWNMVTVRTDITDI